MSFIKTFAIAFVVILVGLSWFICSGFLIIVTGEHRPLLAGLGFVMAVAGVAFVGTWIARD